MNYNRFTVDGTYLDNITLKYGLPQGSALSPKGFYSQDIGHILRKHKFELSYNDDIQIYISVEDQMYIR